MNEEKPSTSSCEDQVLPSSSSVKRKTSDEDLSNDSAVADLDRSPLCRAKEPRVTPLLSLKRGYLSVSNLVHQVWCEKQMLYSLECGRSFDSSRSRRGKNMHLERDLEVNNYNDIQVQTKEDEHAILLVNLLSALYEIQNQLTMSIREVPVYGIFQGILVLGRIDELRVDYQEFCIDIVEFKTRRHKEAPSQSQINKHCVQLMLYKKIFDDMHLNGLPREKLVDVIGLDLNLNLGPSMSTHIEENLGFLKESVGECQWTLSFLIDKIDSIAKFIPSISRCFIEYAWQRDSSIFHLQEIHYEEDWLLKTLSPGIPFWHGEKEAEGVSFEEAWKCHSCEHKHKCNWRRQFSSRRHVKILYER